MIDLPLLYEDEGLIAANKPAGLAVHGGSGISHGVIEQLRAARPEAKFLELVHRLDRDTSGLLLLAKKRSVLTAMHELIRDWADGQALPGIGAGQVAGGQTARQTEAAALCHRRGRAPRQRRR